MIFKEEYFKTELDISQVLSAPSRAISRVANKEISNTIVRHLHLYKE